MKLRLQVIGVNHFLTIVYGSETRLSTLLAALGFGDQQIETLRDKHVASIVHSFIACLRDRIVAGSDGERLYKILSRRLGLDGDPADTLECIGQQSGISRERVRQLQQKVLRRCRARANKRSWETALRDIASALVGPPHGLEHRAGDARQDLLTQVDKGSDSLAGRPAGQVTGASRRA